MEASTSLLASNCSANHRSSWPKKASAASWSCPKHAPRRHRPCRAAAPSRTRHTPRCPSADKLSGGAAKRIDHVSGRDSYPSPGGWLGYLQGGRRLLAYDKWQTFCEPPPAYGCSSGDAWIRVGGTNLVRIAGGRRIVAKRGAGSYRLVAVGGGRMAVEAADGSLKVLAPTGARIATVPASNGDLPLSIALSSTRLAVVRWSRTLDLSY